MHFGWLFSNKAHLKLCFKVRKIWLPFFPCQSLLSSTSILDDKADVTCLTWTKCHLNNSDNSTWYSLSVL